MTTFEAIAAKIVDGIPTRSESQIEWEIVQAMKLAVEGVAVSVEHMRDDYQSTTMPVSKVARLIRELWLTGNGAKI